MRLINFSEWNVNNWRFKLAFVLLCFLLLFLRRPMEFLAPYVWAEDGTWNSPHYLDYGFWSLFQPVQGYLILPSKIITAISLKISFIHYPAISIYLSALFSVLCLYLIAYAPTLLRYKVLCALATILIPSNPEVFVLPLYSFWWGTLLIFLALLWNTEQRSSYLRYFCIGIAGLSSPVVILCAPLFILRTYFYRYRIEVFSTLLVIVLSAIQAYFVFTKASMTNVGLLDVLRDLISILSKFVGQFFFRKISAPADTILMFVVVSFLSWSWYRKRKELGFPFFLIVCLYAVVIFSTVKRVPIELIDPHTAGPRYFFYPFVLFSWALIWLYSVSKDSRAARYIFWFLCSCALLNSTTKFYRLSESPNWLTEIAYCINSSVYHFPINLDGQMHNLWRLQLSKDQCAYLIDQSFLDSERDLKKFPSEYVNFNFSDFNPLLISSLDKFEIVNGSWGMNTLPAEVTNTFGAQMLSSWVGSDAFTGQHKVVIDALGKVVRIAYLTGPVSNNQKILVAEADSQQVVLSVYLKKSDSLAILDFEVEEGKRYEIVLMDLGRGWGEWSAIFIPE